MVSCKKSSILILLILLPLLLSAREIIASSDQKISFRIPYRPSGGNVYKHGNAILREMAKELVREPWLVNIRVSCNLRLSIIKDDSRTQLYISMGQLVVDGDTVYRRFPVADILLPAFVNMKLRWANRADTSGYTEERVSGKPISLADSMVCVVPAAFYDPDIDTLMVREIEFVYDSVALRTFYNRIELIHDYYASASLLDSLQQFTYNLALEDARLLPINYLKIEELCGVMARIDSLDFPDRLLRNGYDPSKLMGKFSQMYKQSRSCIYNFIDGMHRAGAIPWDGNIDNLAGYFTSRVFSYVRRSYLMDQQQGHIYGDCLGHFFDQTAFPPDENVAAAMLAKMFPDARQDTVAHYISMQILAAYQSTSQQLMIENRFAEAFSMMENARQFIARNPSLRDFTDDDQLQSKAALGICNSYIGIASACILGHKYNMAEAYLVKADHYMADHPKFIKSDSAYRAVFSELFFLRNTDCDNLLGLKKYVEALDCYQQFEKTYSAHDLAVVSQQLDEKKSLARMGLGNLSASLSENALKHKSADTALFYYEQATALRQDAKTPGPVDLKLDSLAPAMAQIKFGHLAITGAIALGKRQFTLAVATFTEAKSLSDKYQINRGRDFDSINRQAVKNYLIVQLSAAQKKIWANQFDSAQVALERAEAAGSEYGLLNESDLTSAIAHYKIKIQDQKCRILQDSVDLRMIRANLSIALKNFMNSSRYFNEALTFILTDTACHGDQDALADSVAKYMKPSDYQRKEGEANALVSIGEYSGAIALILELRDFYKTANLARFGLEEVDLFQFISGKNNPHLTETAVNFLIDNKQPHEALRFLSLLKDQGGTAKQVKTLQKILEDYTGFSE